MQGCDTPSEGFAWRKTPIAASMKYAASPTSPGLSTGWREKTRPTPPLHRHFREKTRPTGHETPISGDFERAGRTFSRSHPHQTEQGELFRAFTIQQRRRENFFARAAVGPPVRYPSATRPNWCGERRRDRSGRHRRNHRTRPQCELRTVGRANTGSQGHRQTNFAHNSPRSLFETTRKRCNSNDITSISKEVSGELRAKLLRRQQDPSQTNFACNSIGPNFNKPRKRCNSNDTTSISKKSLGNCMRH